MKGAIDRRVDSARADADAARKRVLITLGSIRRKLDPRIVVSEAAEDASAGVQRLVDQAAEAAKGRPWAVGLAATVAGLGLALLAKGVSRDDAAPEQAAAAKTSRSRKPKIADES